MKNFVIKISAISAAFLGVQALAAVVSLTVNPSDYTTSTGIVIPAGAGAIVTAEGEWDVCGGACPGDADGSYDPGFGASCPGVEGRVAGELIASVDGGATFTPVGAGPTTVTGPGLLLLAANDCGDLGDNYGEVTAQVTVVPLTKAACMGGGWSGLTRSDGITFRNQGDCVSYVTTGR